MQDNLESYEFCRQTLQNEAPDLYVISLMGRGAAQRKALWASFAFTHEIAKTRKMVTEPTLGLIRLQWWRDELAKLYEAQQDLAANPVLQALNAVVPAYALPQESLDKIIDVYDVDLRQSTPLQTLDEALDYAATLQRPLLELSAFLEGIGAEDEAALTALARNRGLAEALPRAQPHSIIGQNREAAAAAFKAKLKLSSHILQAFQNHSALILSDIAKGRGAAYSANLAFRLWTSLLLKW